MKLIAASLLGMALLLARAEGPPDQFVVVNGVRLHYLDWGGRGETVVFLAGLGDSVHRFDSFAPKFVDRFHTLGFTRRGQEESERPATGYDVDTLVNDIRGFLDAKGIRRATLVGHSIAGFEMTAFAARYPERLSGLVYLDAAYDYARAYELAVAGGLAKPNADRSLEAINVAARVHPDYTKVSVPALAFFVLYDQPYLTSRMDAEARASRELAFRILEGSYKRQQIELFKTGVKAGRVIEWHDTNHFFFQDPKHANEAAAAIRTLLDTR